MAFWFTCEGCAKDFLRNGDRPAPPRVFCGRACRDQYAMRLRTVLSLPVYQTRVANPPLSVAPLKCLPDASERPAIRYPGVRV